MYSTLELKQKSLNMSLVKLKISLIKAETLTSAPYFTDLMLSQGFLRKP